MDALLFKEISNAPNRLYFQRRYPSLSTQTKKVRCFHTGPFFMINQVDWDSKYSRCLAYSQDSWVPA